MLNIVPKRIILVCAEQINNHEWLKDKKYNIIKLFIVSN
ncbi:MAG: hypothetical protein MRERV_1c067 [Mycoplasmataceae bacterium RV_VA103A]|nr:MAG: hypothetical protein MRERV_1c067 [Mycoplasmataceae bacterium RV_VA103A]